MGPGGGGGGGGSNNAYSGAPNSSAMMPGTAGPAGMMQNTALPQVPNNGQSKSTFPLSLNTFVSHSKDSSPAQLLLLLFLCCFKTLYSYAAPPQHQTICMICASNWPRQPVSDRAISFPIIPIILTNVKSLADKNTSGLSTSVHKLTIWAECAIYSRSPTTGPV